MEEASSDLVELTTQMVSAYLEATTFAAEEIPDLIKSVHGALADLGKTPTEPALGPTTGKLTAAQVRKSIKPDGLVSFEDGRIYKMLKRHLANRGLTPAEYRAKWGLPAGYPMTAPAYSAARSAMAKHIGLGSLQGRSPKPSAKAVKPPARK